MFFADTAAELDNSRNVDEEGLQLSVVHGVIPCTRKYTRRASCAPGSCELDEYKEGNDDCEFEEKSAEAFFCWCYGG